MVEDEGHAICLSHPLGGHDNISHKRWAIISSNHFLSLVANIIILGYDGSLMNGLEAIQEWKESKFVPCALSPSLSGQQQQRQKEKKLINRVSLQLPSWVHSRSPNSGFVYGRNDFHPRCPLRG